MSEKKDQLISFLELAEDMLKIHKAEASTVLIHPIIDIMYTHARNGFHYYSNNNKSKGFVAVVKLYMALEAFQDLSIVTSKLFTIAMDSPAFIAIREFIDQKMNNEKSTVYQLLGKVATKCNNCVYTGNADGVKELYLKHLYNVAKRNVEGDYESVDRQQEVMSVFICEYFHHDNFPEHYVEFHESFPLKGTEVVTEQSSYFDKHGNAGIL